MQRSVLPEVPRHATLHWLQCSDPAGDIGTSKSTSRSLFTLASALSAGNQSDNKVVDLSSCEVEYIAAATTPTQSIWLARLLSDLIGRDAEVVDLRVDNKSTLVLATDPVFHEHNKHIRVRYHFIRSFMEQGSIKANHISTHDQLADCLTKSLGRVKFQELRAKGLGLSRPHRRLLETWPKYQEEKIYELSGGATQDFLEEMTKDGWCSCQNATRSIKYVYVMCLWF